VCQFGLILSIEVNAMKRRRFLSHAIKSCLGRGVCSQLAPPAPFALLFFQQSAAQKNFYQQFRTARKLALTLDDPTLSPRFRAEMAGSQQPRF